MQERLTVECELMVAVSEKEVATLMWTRKEADEGSEHVLTARGVLVGFKERSLP